MPHPRKTLRTSVRAQLVAAGLTPEAAVRTALVPLAQLTALDVTTPSERSARLGRDQSLERIVQMEVVATVRAQGASVEDALDDFCALVEAAWAANDTWGGSCSRSTLTGTTTDLAPGADDAAQAVLTFDCVIHSGPVPT
jgi:hypothetical protein